MINKFVVGAIVSAVSLTILPASAADWGTKITACAAAAQEQGLAKTGDYDLKFLSGSARRLTIEMTPADGSDAVVAVCKISRGKVKDVQLKA